MKQHKKIEYLSQSNDSDYVTSYPASTQKSSFSLRIKLFCFTFLCCLSIGLVINYARPAVYQSEATLLTLAATAVDQNSGDVDFQHVIIQEKKLLGFDLLSAVVTKLRLVGEFAFSIDDIRRMLRVTAVENTNLLTMIANGNDPQVLPLVINTWIDVYLEARALNVKNSTKNTVELVTNELDELDLKLEQATNNLDQFRKANDISSIVREENELPATQLSLTQALNQANEQLVKSKAKLDAVNNAIAMGQTVVPNQEERSLSQLEKRYQELKEKLAEFDKRFTRDYLELQPSLKFIPEQIKQLEKEIRSKQQRGKSIVWTEVNQEYHAAKLVVSNIRLQLDEHKQKAMGFTHLFAMHQKLVADLESLELINRETRERLIKIESKQFEKYPQVDVVERASVNMQAISPDYTFGALVVLLISFMIALLMLWLIGFLMQGSPEQQPVEFPLATWLGFGSYQNVVSEKQAENVIEQQMYNGLPHLNSYQKLSIENVSLLLKNANEKTQLLILLLLSGLTISEITTLTREQINLDKLIIQFNESPARIIPIGKKLFLLIENAVKNNTLWGVQEEISVDDVNAMLYCCEVDAGLKDESALLADTLRQTYVIYLVEQGIRLTLLEQIVGYQSSLELASYAVYSPAVSGFEMDQIKLTYPLCS